MSKNHLVTGPPGAGKTALIAELRARGLDCIDEPARRVLAEQRKIDGQGVPDREPALFTELMLATAVEDFGHRQAGSKPVFFDRGVPDIVAYARLFGVDDRAALQAARRCRYGATAFFAPPWRAIYRQDDERKMTFDAAQRFGAIMRDVYGALGYQIIDLPLASIAERAGFLLAQVARGASLARTDTDHSCFRMATIPSATSASTTKPCRCRHGRQARHHGCGIV